MAPATFRRNDQLGEIVIASPPLDLVSGELLTDLRAAIDEAADTEIRADGIAVVAGAPDNLVDREPGDELHPPDLRPALHVEHCLPPRKSH
jgi:hypothetical protein